ncbi:Intracellular distribution of mitochondria [Sporothrix curviconia]|uniref:Clustered mitochondria protein homolog n=1 Tax=Sporothrix curviconia TaxID=1260050 RepID=A0ABP0B813_9PEZI
MATSEDQGNAPPAAPVEDEVPAENAVAEQVEGEDADLAAEESLYNLTIVLPHSPEKLSIMIYAHEQVSEVRQAIIESPAAQQYSCFHLEYKGAHINEFGQVSDIADLALEADIHVVEDPYTEKEARLHVIRIRDLIGAAGNHPDTVHGVLPGLSLFDSVTVEATAASEATPVEFDFTAPADQTTLLPRLAADEPPTAPKPIKSLQISPWNPPPAHLRQKGHLMYLIVTTNEGEQFQITSHVAGFYVNKSSNSKFDPLPRPSPKSHSAHSLLSLIQELSPSFAETFVKLQEYNSRRDPLSTFQITNALPAAPWLVPALSSPACAHSADITRTQEAFLVAGTENVDNLRDWNEELQSARELPRDTVQDRIFRERLVAKVFADYIDAATRGALLVACGEVGPLNPTEARDAQIFVYNNIFFSFGADGVGTFTSEGGDEAARVATGKDVTGVRRINQLDLDGLYSPGTVVVDYLGKRIVGQSLVPGIFKQREPGENQIDYGAVDGKDVVAADERFVAPFAKMSQALNVKRHAVWDKDQKRHELEASVETKGLMGTDGRKYVLDLYRITPLDILWQEEGEEAEKTGAAAYPHRMAVLRPELIDNYSRVKMREWLDGELAKRNEVKTKAEAEAATKEGESKEGESKEGESKEGEAKEGEAKEGEAKEGEAEGEAEAEDKPQDNRIDVSDFKFSLNPDVSSGQVPQTEEEKAEMASDEADVRAVCKYLQETTIPSLINDLSESEISFPMDGRSLSLLLHKRGINVRYLGRVAKLSEGEERLKCLYEVAVREMIARAFKHVSAKYLRYLPLPLSSACISHLLNCLLGAALNAQPTADVDPSIRSLYDDAALAFEAVTPESLRADIEAETTRRFRFTLPATWHAEMRNHLQLLREVSLKLGIQILSSKFAFTAEDAAAKAAVAVENGQNGQNGAANGAHATNGSANGGESSKNKKKKKGGRDGSPSSQTSEARAAAVRAAHTFSADDIVNVVPVVKDSAPRGSLAEEALEAGKISLSQGQKKIGQELLLESLSLHEQIYGILHPEVAHAYHTLSMLYYQLDEKDAAVELARKAIIVSERVVGVDSQETLLDYLNLALFLHQQGRSALALEYAKHALRLWRVMYGADHPDVITTMNNAAVMLQSMKAYHESRRWFEESLRVSEQVFGRASLNSATLLFQLAQALALDHDSKGAVSRMRESFNIFRDKLGAEDKNTKEAESWLEQLTQNAVTVAKHAKDQEARRLRAGIKFTTRGAVAGSVVPGAAAGGAAPKTGIVEPASASAAGAAGGKPSMDSRSIDELIRFIEGTDAKKTSSSGGGKKRSSNPKRRGGKA